ncbi:MAG: tRNA pseudouridine(38-40) synthase TruA, partial [Alphaproteobacteria bacterium]|nr:tRNA pseudouridine(38-40) synthase TruA [Alphaproteobacteria bacterium]
MSQQRWVLGLEYLGTHYHGWQSQLGLPTIQDSVQRALSQVADHPVVVYASGRTDKGVHAVNQVVHFDSSAQRLDRQWLLGANRYLPEAIKCRWVKPIDDEFHARFSAVARSYQYVCQLGAPSVWTADRAWWQAKPLDVQMMKDASQLMLGEHDFSGFRGGDCQAKSPIKTIKQIDWVMHQDALMFNVIGNSFLHHMVR